MDRRLEIEQASPEDVRQWINEGLQIAVAQGRQEAYANMVLGEHAALKWFKAYTTREAAELLGMHPSDVGRIPESELPKRKLGLGRGRNGYLGIDLLCYILGREPLDLSAVVDEMRSRFMQASPSVRLINPDRPGKTRVL